MATAMRASVTVSIAAETIGIASWRLRVSRVAVETSFGRTCDSAGTSRTSSKVRPSRANLSSSGQLTPLELRPTSISARELPKIATLYHRRVDGRLPRPLGARPRDRGRRRRAPPTLDVVDEPRRPPRTSNWPEPTTSRRGGAGGDRAAERLLRRHLLEPRGDERGEEHRAGADRRDDVDRQAPRPGSASAGHAPSRGAGARSTPRSCLTSTLRAPISEIVSSASDEVLLVRELLADERLRLELVRRRRASARPRRRAAAARPRCRAPSRRRAGSSSRIISA